MNNEKDIFMKEVQKIRYERILSILDGYEKRGVKVSVQGMDFPLEKCAEIMSVSETDCYMPDLIMNSFGKLVEVNYDKIVQM